MFNRSINAEDKSLLYLYIFYTLKFAFYGGALLLLSIFIDTFYMIKNLFNVNEDIFSIKFEDEFDSIKKQNLTNFEGVCDKIVSQLRE
jgi:hypothetical protein